MSLAFAHSRSSTNSFLLFRNLLKTCIANRDLVVGRSIHALYLKSFIPPDTYLSNHLVLLYSRCRQLNLARQLFDEIPQPNVFSYNTLLAAYVHESQTHLATDLFSRIPNPDLVSFNTLLSAYAAVGRAADAIALFSQMRHFDSNMDGFTLSAVLSSLRLSGVEQFHTIAITTGLYSYVSVNNALICCYSRAGLLIDAEQLFHEIPVMDRDAVSWNCMIVSYGQHREGSKALSLFQEMIRRGFVVDMYTLASVLTVFTTLKDLAGGMQFHSFLIKSAFEKNPHAGSGLADLYSKCCRVSDAMKAFEEVEEPDLVVWNTMISGFSLDDEYLEEGLQFFRRMQRAGFRPDDCSFVCCISACSNLSSPSQGQQLHSLAMKSDFPTNLVSVNNALISMYSKCGNLKDADKLFVRMPERNSVSYNSIIAAYAQHGLGLHALKLFGEMLVSKNEPTSITFISVLSACAHTGRVDEGQRYFDSMQKDHNFEPSEEHYSCMINLLSRAGKFGEVEQMIKTMPFDPGAIGWAAVLGACRTHGNLELGARAAEKLLELDPSNASAYVMLANMHASFGNWEEMASSRKLMRDRGVRKKPGCSWIEMGKVIHLFVADDVSHPQIKDIYRFLEEISEKMKQAGYVPDVKWSLVRDDVREGVARLGHHSEKLAVAFGLISTADGTPILVMKNLRICGDCHNAIKFISKIAGREITVRDAHRFHCFSSDGSCSCGEFW
ncbi:pentatricopeptide repeat-containing protein At3g49710 [Phalaenopsis equestris]|uniref:pentatricopeptide repeat-containing protein At3g49710 n=1 Tax=Phalaenopsis equestris TaxID=78828 RepID=UPI0009E1FDEA|nr:pentatricopeptide repeat-containing protein At3g49710 [Phalaenopsis equestris]